MWAGSRPHTASAATAADGKSVHANACDAYLGTRLAPQFSAIFTADPGDFSGTPEAHHILANLRDAVTKPRDTTVCGGVASGRLMGQPVVVVTTGIGPPAAALCTQEVLSACGPSIQEIVYLGTSGWSPQLGGVLDPPKCHAANGNKKITRLGDVCISPFTVNWTCKKTSWSQQAAGYPNQCYRPPEASSPNATALYGECQFYKDNLEANLALADELLAVARSKAGLRNMPARSATAAAVEREYWTLMEEATGVKYPPTSASDTPTLWDYKQCAEIDSQLFYTGVPFEVKARDYAAQVISAALGAQLGAGDVVAVSAMEGIGVGEALLKYHALSSTLRRIPFTNVRTLSNWLHQPVKQAAPGVWHTAHELPEDYVTGYAYAIATGSATVMSLYQGRCQEDVLRQRLPHDTDCGFVIDYGGAAVGMAQDADSHRLRPKQHMPDGVEQLVRPTRQNDRELAETN